MPEESKNRAPVLDPIDRASEIIFGVLMVLTFTGSLSVATAGSQQIRAMMFAALGCNIAWGLTDAVMYLVGTVTERYREVALLRRIQTSQDLREAHHLIADVLPGQFAEDTDEGALESVRRRLLRVIPPPTGLGARDYAGALGVFVLVVFATFPAVVPFLFIADAAIALRISNVLSLATLFVAGFLLGRYASGNPWRFGFGMVAIGVALVMIIIALGG